jgi:hypothetical protein
MIKKLVYGLFICVFTVVTYCQNVIAGVDKVNLDVIPGVQKVAAGDSFTLIVVADSDVKIGAYDFEIIYPENKIEIISITAGKDGSLAASNIELKGLAKANGFEISGIGPGDDLELLIIEGIALVKETRKKKDVLFIKVKPKHLTDEFGKELERTKKVKAKIGILY